MSRSAALAAALALAATGPTLGWSPQVVAGAAPVPPTGAGAGAQGPARSFSARIAVEWVDGQGRHTTMLDLRAGAGQVRVAGAAGADGPLVLGDGWLLVTSGPGGMAGALAPAIERKYEVERLAGPVVAGRPTDLVVLRAGGEVREKLAIDQDLGLVLRRELFGEGDRPVRTVTVTDLDFASPEPPASPVPAEEGEPVDPQDLGNAYGTPQELAGGYSRVGAFRRDRVVHVLYGDGLHGLSLFVQPGRIDRDRLPAGAEAVPVNGTGGLRYTWAGGEIVTWESGPVVRTLVGDAATAEVLAAARSVPPAPPPSLVNRLRSASRQVAEVLGAA